MLKKCCNLEYDLLMKLLFRYKDELFFIYWSYNIFELIISNVFYLILFKFK